MTATRTARPARRRASAASTHLAGLDLGAKLHQRARRDRPLDLHRRDRQLQRRQRRRRHRHHQGRRRRSTSTATRGVYDGNAARRDRHGEGRGRRCPDRPGPGRQASPTCPAARPTGPSPTRPATTTTPAATSPSSSPRPTRRSPSTATPACIDGNAHGATGTAKGVGGADLAGSTSAPSFTNVPGGTAHWTFTDATGNYNNASGDAAIVISKADATVAVNGYTGVYDGNAHGATGTAKGVGGVRPGRPRPRRELHQRARRHGELDLHRRDRQLQRRQRHGGHRDPQGRRRRSRSTATPACYDGNAHGATGTAKGVGGRRPGRPGPRRQASPTCPAARPTGRSPTRPATTTTPAARRPS